MGNTSSTTGDPSLADSRHSYMSKISRPNKQIKFQNMATTLDTQIPHHENLNHDTLMGLQELDSHLSMFDTSNLGRESSTPGAMSNSAFEDAIKTVEKPASVIAIDQPDKDFSPEFESDSNPPNLPLDNGNLDSIIV